MAKAPSTAASFDGSGNVWFKVYQLSAVTDGGSTIKFPSDSKLDCQARIHNNLFPLDISQVTFKIPSTLPAGEYLVRIEHIALHVSLNFSVLLMVVSS